MRISAFTAPILATSMLLLGCERVRSADSNESASVGTDGLHFVDVAAQSGLHDFVHRTGAAGAKWLPETMGGGGGFVDHNGDGWVDILLVGGGTWSRDEPVRALRLYRNNRDGTFSDVTEEAGLADVRAYGFGVVSADYDNDGDDDFFLTTLGENLLFRNDGRFVEVGREAGVAGSQRWSTSAVFFDADRDGWVDLFVGNYVSWSPERDIFCTVDGLNKSYCQPTLYDEVSPEFYHNNGDGTFTEETAGAGFDGMPGKTLGAVELDFNRDGWPDLAVANDTQRDLLFVNAGDGSFVESGVLSGTAFDDRGQARGGMGIDAGVMDSTGEESIFVGNFSNEMIGVYRHVGDGMFADRAAVSKIGRPSLRKVTFGLFLFDADLDGDLDVFAANGNIRDETGARQSVPFRQEAQLYLNGGNGTFEPFVPPAGDAMAESILARGAAFADYDRDGDVDILVLENGGPAHLWRNELLGEHAAPSRRSLRVLLAGVRSNRDGLGAQVEVVLGGRRMHRRVRAGSSYLSASEKAVTFGLGNREAADSLVVRWPSGRIDRFANVESGQEIRIREGSSWYEILSKSPRLSPSLDS